VSDRVIRHIVVRGRVQGVGYRAFVEDEARQRGLEGWVRNRRDGSVEAVFAGPAADVEAAIDANKKDLDDATSKRIDQQNAIATLINKDYSVEADEPRRRYRNGVINDFLAIADFHYYDFRNQLMAGRASSDTLLDISELLLSTATTLTGGLVAKTNLGASSTLLKGSRSAVDKNFFVQQTLAAIINGIEDRRQKDRADIVKKMQQTTDQYPLAQALSDVQLYQSRASLVAGAMAVANETANKSNVSEKALQDAQLNLK